MIVGIGPNGKAVLCSLVRLVSGTEMKKHDSEYHVDNDELSIGWPEIRIIVHAGQLIHH